MPKPLPWLPSLLHWHGLDIPSLIDGSNWHLSNPDESKGEGKDEGEEEEEEDRVAQDKTGEDAQDIEVVVVVVVDPTDFAAVAAAEEEEEEESEKGGIEIGWKTTSWREEEEEEGVGVGVGIGERNEEIGRAHV